MPHRAATVLLILVLFTLATPLAAGEREAVERAVLDYFEGIEQARPELIERSVHRELTKFGFYRPQGESEHRAMPMDFDALVQFARTFKQQGHVPDNPTHSVEIFEVLDRTASVKLTAFWGIDYVHLAKYDGKWMIVQVLWQSAPAGGE
jgi:hypothetical protein